MQALCPACNIKKGNSMSSGIKLRQWQSKALGVYERMGRPRDFLVVATPGGGKTVYAGTQIQEMEDCDRVVVVVPTTSLKTQWAEEMHKLGLSIEPSWGTGGASYSWPRGFDGIAVTYAQVGSNPEVVAAAVNSRTAVVFDEVHHCGDQASWGQAIMTAFGHAGRRLLLSGTPWRTRGDRIPFVKYDEGGKSTPDVHYSMMDALADGVIRSVYFHRMDGEFRWQDHAGVEQAATFADELSDCGESQRLATAIDPDQGWFETVIVAANARLMEMRQTDPDAAGIVFAKDVNHARRSARRMAQLIGVEPVVVVSNDDDPSAANPHNAIKRFSSAGCSDPWIVAVRMVSEGVDIKRLRVGVYATNIVRELFFRQAVGRILRVDGEDKTADMWIPDDPRISQMAANIAQDVECVAKEREENGEGDGGDIERDPSLFQPLSGTGLYAGAIGIDAEYSADEIRYVEQLKARDARFGAMSSPLIVDLLRQHGVQMRPAAPEPKMDSPPLYVQKEQIRARIKWTVSKIAKRYNLEHRVINKQLGKLTAYTSDASIEQLKAKESLAEQWLKNGVPHAV